jgi:hypothetical protein
MSAVFYSLVHQCDKEKNLAFDDFCYLFFALLLKSINSFPAEITDPSICCEVDTRIRETLLITKE